MPEHKTGSQHMCHNRFAYDNGSLASRLARLSTHPNILRTQLWIRIQEHRAV